MKMTTGTPLTNGRRAGRELTHAASELLTSAVGLINVVGNQIPPWLMLLLIRLTLPRFCQCEPKHLGKFQFPRFENLGGYEFTRSSRLGDRSLGLIHGDPFHEHVSKSAGHN